MTIIGRRTIHIALTLSVTAGVVAHSSFAAASTPACPSGHKCITVTGTKEGTNCTLIDAVIAIDTEASYGKCGYKTGDDTILLPLLSGSSTTFDISAGLYLPGATIIGMGVTKTILSFGTGTLVTTLGIELDAGYSGGSSGLSQLTVQGVHPSAPSTAILVDGSATATLTNVKVTGFTNSGIVNYGQLTIHQSTISNNSTNADGGGILNLEGGIVNMAASTINGNSAISGGGIYSLGQLFMAYSTIAGNVAEGASGGGINVAANSDGSPSGLNAYHITITDNAAEFGNQCGAGGGVFIDQTTSGSVDFNASIIARNENINAQADDYVGPIHGESEIEDGANKDILGHFTPGCGSNFGTFVAMDGRNGQMVPILDFTASSSSLFGNNHLASNSGPTQTVALATNSPAIKASQNDAFNLGIYNAVDPGGMSTTQDQRGSAAPSPKGSHFDLGAYEHN